MCTVSKMTLKDYFFEYEGFSNLGTTQDHARMQDISNNMAQIEENIDKYKEIYNDISNNYGISGEVPEFETTDRNDALKHDLHYVMGQQKNTYMLGMVTIATLGIATFYIARKY